MQPVNFFLFGILSLPLATLATASSLTNAPPLIHLPTGFNGSNSTNVELPSDNYPLDPYQLRVPGTTTSLIFSKYGPQVNHHTLLTLIAKAQYSLVQSVVAAQGDGPVPRSRFEWTNVRTYVRLERPLRANDLTWLMLADAMEGLRVFFEGRIVWFETQVTILDDMAGVVGSGIVGSLAYP